MEEVTVAILAGGTSKRFGSEKSLAEFQGKSLISHMITIARNLSSEVIVVVSDEVQETNLCESVKGVRVVVDPPSDIKCALAGALTAFEYTLTPHTLLLPVDTPLANVELLRVIVGMSTGHGAVVPTWPSGYIEPLHSVYLAEHAYYHGLKVMEKGRHKMSDMLDALQNVLFVSTETLKQFDSDLDTFVNFNTLKDLKNAERKYSKKRSR
ncbi:MAG: molybdenum cofactor guanylyltransferase [Candidatus Thorarchaeota archaeon]|jgi:molybdopterin-guanine dinucleotide biosynthesis protein A